MEADDGYGEMVGHPTEVHLHSDQVEHEDQLVERPTRRETHAHDQ